MIPVPAGWLPPTLVGRALALDGPVPPALPEERPPASAVPARHRERAAGRACAREALVALGAPPAAIPSRPDRTPAFPAGVVGSVTHSRTLAAAAVGWAAGWSALGIDVEPEAVHPDLIPLVATPAERAGLRPGDETRLFSAKESLFKCWYTAGGGRILEFHEVEVEVRADGALIVLRQPAPAVAAVGRWARAEGHWWTAWWAAR